MNEHEPYETYAPDFGFVVGYINQVSGTKSRKQKHPIGFSAPSRKKRRFKKKDWPEVGRL